MIITRTPFRVSFLGGGTDLPWFYKDSPGAVISTTINKYIYIAGHAMFNPADTLLKYSKTELVKDTKDIEHPIFRAVLQRHNPGGVDISVSADIPAGTGLGSSSAFTVGLLNLAHNLLGTSVSRAKLAEEACDIEINVLGERIGKQDQYASTWGSLNYFSFSREAVSRKKLILSGSDEEWLNSAMVLVQVGAETRSTNEILGAQWKAALEDNQKIKALEHLADLTNQAADIIESDILKLPELITEGWELKKLSNPFCSTDEIDQLIAVGKKNGALGWKLLGAGQSGFVLFLVSPEDRDNFVSKMSSKRSIQVSLDHSGSKVIYRDSI